jgi:hypothetical protein
VSIRHSHIIISIAILIIIPAIAIVARLLTSRWQQSSRNGLTGISRVASDGGTSPTNSWSVYRNDSFRFAVSYPPGWVVTSPSAGEARVATATDSVVTVAPSLYSDGVSFTMTTLGSRDIGTYFASASSLNDYVGLMFHGVPSTIVKFSGTQMIGGYRALRYEDCSNAQKGCFPELFVQHSKDIINIANIYVSVDAATFETLLKTVRFY